MAEWARGGLPREITVTDRYGDARIVHRDQRDGKLKLKRTNVTPILALNQEIGRLFGARVRQFRKARGYTLAELCTRAGLVSVSPKSRMWEIENSVRVQGIRLGTIFALAMALDVEVCDLLPSVDEVRRIADIGPASDVVRVNGTGAA